MPRIINDFYETPPHYVHALKDVIGEPPHVIEPCVGDGAISKHFPSIITNDIDITKTATTHMDAATSDYWRKIPVKDFPGGFIITNPPFSCAIDILENAYNLTNFPIVMCLWLSFLELTKRRYTFLKECPPTGLIVLPRYSFRLNDKGKRQTDSVTCAWMLWRSYYRGIIYPKFKNET